VWKDQEVPYGRFSHPKIERSVQERPLRRIEPTQDQEGSISGQGQPEEPGGIGRTNGHGLRLAVIIDRQG
jgi:hypothetical protein